jgi:nucleoid-associated protein YgaU
MTTDAKIGLLLSFLFIVIIAFLINGLPDFLKSESAGERVTVPITGLSAGSADLTGQADEAIKAFNTMQTFRQPRQTEQPVKDGTDIRFTTKLPTEITTAAGQIKQLKPDSSKEKPLVESYIVQSGDNLAVIAKRIYGSQQGNKRIIVNAIFQANRSILRSPDHLAVGQELIIPPLAPAVGKYDEKKRIPAAGIFEKVKAFAGKNLSSLKSAVHRPGPAEYVVESGDNLWKIADRFLGNPSRYDEIVELNRDTIYDAEDIPVGMCLKLPNR